MEKINLATLWPGIQEYIYLADQQDSLEGGCRCADPESEIFYQAQYGPCILYLHFDARCNASTDLPALLSDAECTPCSTVLY